ncbi:MAG TPA: hypothetical protein VFV02_16255, partial [Acidimicrobiales bacterium]|nr:hypothetical protein [Acidimicrobiales bacterium]
MVAALVAAACMPVAWPLLGGGPEAAKAAVALLGAAGGGYINDFLKALIERLRRGSSAPTSKAELQEVLEHELVGGLQAETEQSAGLRSEAAALLQRVQAVETALGSASADVQLALTEAFTRLGNSFGEFRWMLQETHRSLDTLEREQARQGAEQRHQTDLLREFRIKINLALRRLDDLAIPGATSTAAYEAPQEEGVTPAPTSGPSPYKGLEAFQPEDAEWFFGRDRLVAELAVRLSESPFLAAIGPSGSGKSSVLRAGLLPRMWSGKLPGEGGWATITMTPGTHPLEELAAQVGAESGVPAGLLLEDWRAYPGRLRPALRQVLAKTPAISRLLLLVDQFEEVFTLCSDETERQGFIRSLAGIVEDSGNNWMSVVLGIRADFYARCGEYPELVRIMQDRQVMVGPMAEAELREAITGPAAHAGLVLQPGLVETVLLDLGQEPGSLPLLSHALFATWQRREGGTLTLAGYREAGGVHEAIARTAEAVFSQFDPAQQHVTKDVFMRLTALGEGTEDTRRRVRRAELVAGRELGAIRVLLERLADARLVSLGEDSVEVAHEALIRAWPRLRRWLAEDREGLLIHRRLTEAASQWEALGRDPGALYRGGILVGARDWAAGNQTRLNVLERTFLVASGERERDELAAIRRRKRRRALIAILVVVSVVAVQQLNMARRAQDLATARQLAAQATANSDQQPLSLLLSLESLRIVPTNQGWAALQWGLLHPRHNVVALFGHEGPVSSVAQSPDGRIIASASDDGELRLWDAASRRAIGKPLAGHKDQVTSVAFSPDGKMIASAGADQAVRLWDIASLEPARKVLTGHKGRVRGVAFSPDGKTVASAGADKTVQLWDIASPTPTGTVLSGNQDSVNGVAFS